MNDPREPEDIIARIKQIINSWRKFDDDDKFSMYDKNFTARCILAEILRLVEGGK